AREGGRWRVMPPRRGKKPVPKRQRDAGKGRRKARPPAGGARHAKRAALFGTAQMRRDQNSAGRYPLISRPMQTSTRVGVVQAIGRSLAFNAHVKSGRADAQAPRWQAEGKAELPSNGENR